MHSVCVILSLFFFLPITAGAQPVPLALERVGVWPAAPASALATQRSLVAWGQGRQMTLGRLRSDGTIAVVSRLLLDGTISDIALAGSQAVAVVGWNHLAFVDISDPRAPTVRQRADARFGITRPLIWRAPHLFMTVGGEIQVWSLEPMGSARKVGSWRAERGVSTLAATGSILVASDDWKLHILDASSPRQPRELAALDVPRGVGQFVLAARGDRVLADYHGGGLGLFDISDPADPALLASTDGFAAGSSIVMLDGFALVAREWDGLLSVDISDPTRLRVKEIPGLVPAELAPTPHGVLALGSDGVLSLVVATAHGAAVTSTALDVGIVGPVYDLELLPEGRVIANMRGRETPMLRALHLGDDGRLEEWASRPSPGWSDAVVRLGTDLFSLGSSIWEDRFTLFRLDAATIEAVGSCCDGDYGEPIVAAADGIVWTGAGWTELNAVDLSDLEHPLWTSGMWLASAEAPYRDVADDRIRAMIYPLWGGVAVPASWLEDGLLARWIDWVHGEPGLPYQATIDHQVRLIDVRVPAAPVEVGRYSSDERIESIARHGDRLLISLFRDGAMILQALSIADPATPTVVAERQVDHLPVDAVPFGPWLIGRGRSHDTPMVLVDPDSLEVYPLDAVTATDSSVADFAALWPYLAVSWRWDAVELYRAVEP